MPTPWMAASARVLALSVTGTTGEPSTLTVVERIALFGIAVGTVAGRIPVVAACGSQSHAATVEMVAGAERAGADARSRSLNAAVEGFGPRGGHRQAVWPVTDEGRAKANRSASVA